jgi:hypothetical protein
MIYTHVLNKPGLAVRSPLEEEPPNRPNRPRLQLNHQRGRQRPGRRSAGRDPRDRRRGWQSASGLPRRGFRADPLIELFFLLRSLHYLRKAARVEAGADDEAA